MSPAEVWVVAICAFTFASMVGMVTLAWWSVRVAQAMADRPVHVRCDCEPDPPDVDWDGLDAHWAPSARGGGDQ